MQPSWILKMAAMRKITNIIISLIMLTMYVVDSREVVFAIFQHTVIAQCARAF